MKTKEEFEVSVAPMLGVSTPEYRRFMQIVSPRSLVFTEMVVDISLIHMSSEVLERKIGLPTERCVLQLGGSDPEKIARAAQRAQRLGYTKMNLNCGCPSDRVQSGKFGAVLMQEPMLIARIVQQTYEATGIVLSVKCRTGVDSIEDYASFKSMIGVIVENSPCRTFYVHARKCLLKGLSPADNRRVPPLTYNYVFQIKKDFPHLKIILNGGLRDTSQVLEVADKVDGVMLGRKPMDSPMFFAELEHCLFNTPCITAYTAIQKYLTLLSTLPKKENQDRFFALDTQHTSKSASPRTNPSTNPSTNTNITTDRTTDRTTATITDITTDTITDITTDTITDTANSICRYIDIKPIEGVLYGQRGCKEYKRALSSLVRQKLAFQAMLEEVQKVFAALQEHGSKHEEDLAHCPVPAPPKE
ncbi:tRNA-dihydrouridine synthase A [Nematocida sp. AWRm77]|nr:tRNA-dihydrouridine synthase A [Nematocida sp. AWRm77]